MGVHSGKYGAVSGVSTNRMWQLNTKVDPKAYVASNTQGGTGRVRGNSDFTGSIGAYGGQPARMPGVPFTFVGFTAPESGSNGSLYTGDAIADSVQIDWNWGDAAIITHTINFGGVGALVETQAASPGDSSFPVAPSPIGLLPLYSVSGTGGSGFEELMNVLSASLTISAANKPYVNSSTNGLTSRAPGNIDWKCSVVVQENNVSDLPFTEGELVQLRLPCGGTDPWDLAWGILSSIGGFEVNRESGDIIKMTLEFEMAGFDPSGDGIGYVKLPDGTTFWPAS